MRLLVFLLIPSIVFGWNVFGYGDSCTYTREDAIKCFKKHVDLNHDGVISVKELSTARRRYVGPLIKILQWFVSWKIDTSTKHVIRDCDYDHDGKFTADDFRKSYKTCIASQTGLCLVKQACEKADEHYRSWF